MEKFNKFKWTGWLLKLLCLISLCLFPSTAQATANPEGQVVVVVVDGVNLEELTLPEHQAINKLMNQGAVGLLNARTGGGLNTPNSYVTLGAGKKAIASPSSGLAFNARSYFEDRVAADIFFARTGQRAEEDNVLFIGAPGLAKLNATTDYGATPGLLGESLKKIGVKTVVIGNSDTGQGYGGMAALIAMDTKGVVSGGNVGASLNQADNRWPYGLRTNYQALWSSYSQWRGTKSLIVIDTADTYRLNRGRGEVPEATWQNLRQVALQDADKFIGRIAAELDWSKDRLLILSPTPSPEAIQQGNVLTPMIMVGKDIPPGSLLKSVNTRKNGLALMSDVAPTITSFWGGKMVHNVLGRPVQFAPVQGHKDYILSYHQKIFTGFKDRVWVLVPVCIVWFLIVGLTLYSRLKKTYSRTGLLRKGLLLVILLPVGLLWIPVLNLETWYLKVLGVLLITSFLWLTIIGLVKGGWQRLLATAGLVSLGLMAEAFTSGKLSQFSPLGFDLILGARYYGLGNEFMGLLIAAIVLLVAMIYQLPLNFKYRHTLAVLAYFLATVSLALPVFGANLGGTITAVVTFSVMGLKLQDKQIGWRERLYIVMGVLMVIAFVTIVDLTKNTGDSSHIAKAIMALSSGNLEELQRIIDRKVSMNLRILRTTGWSLLLWLVGSCYLVFHPQPWLHTLINRYWGLGAALVGGAIGSVTALVFNDSGAIAAACIMALLTPAVLYLDLLEQRG